MGEVIDFQKWKEKKEQERVIKVINNLFLTTDGAQGLEVKYFMTTDLIGNPYMNFEYTSD